MVASHALITSGLDVCCADGTDASSVLQAGAQHKVLIIPGYLTSAQHLQIMAQQQQEQQQTELPVCPFFRVSFASVDAKAMLEGFARLRAAIKSRAAALP
jgi:DNA-binding transcriptional MocR family regulator